MGSHQGGWLRWRHDAVTVPAETVGEATARASAPASHRRRPPTWVLTQAGYVLLAVVMTWPLLLHLGDRFAGDNPVDAWGHYWNMWWFRRVLLTGTDPYFTDLWFAPEGASLFLHTLAPFNSLLGLLPTLVAGPLVAYNLVALATIALAGQAAFLLARHVTGHTSAAIVAGIAFAASPYLLGHLNVGHLNVAMLAWLPLFVLALLRALEGRRWYLALAAGALFMTALCEWHTTIFAGLVGAVVIAWYGLLAARRQAPWEAPLRGMVAMALGGLLLLPLAAATALAVERIGDRAELGERWAERHSANIVAFVLPQDLHPLWGLAVETWREENLEEVLTEGRVSLGWVVLVLAVVGAVSQRWRALPWLAITALGLGLAMGPELHVGEDEVHLLTPFDLFSDVPYLDVSRTPARFAVVAVVALVVLAAFGVRWLAEHVAGGRRPVLVAALAGLLVTGEFLTAPYPLSPLPDTEVARRIGQEIAATDPQGAILTFPYRSAEQERVFHQVHHERPIFGGFIPRDIDRPFRALTPGFADLASDRPFVDIFQPAPEPLAVLNYFHVRYILFYRGEVLEPAGQRTLEERLQRLLRETEPTYVSSGGGLEAWRVPSVPVEAPFLRTGRGWHPVETFPGIGRGRWMGQAATLYLERPQATPVTVSFQAFSYAKPRRLEVSSAGHLVGVYTIPPGDVMQIEVPLPAAQGTTDLRLRSLDGTDSPFTLQGVPDKRDLSVGLANVRILPQHAAGAPAAADVHRG